MLSYHMICRLHADAVKYKQKLQESIQKWKEGMLIVLLCSSEMTSGCYSLPHFHTTMTLRDAIFSDDVIAAIAP